MINIKGYESKNCKLYNSFLTVFLGKVTIKLAFISKGVIAQLGERLVRNEKVRGSIPLNSTIDVKT